MRDLAVFTEHLTLTVFEQIQFPSKAANSGYILKLKLWNFYLEISVERSPELDLSGFSIWNSLPGNIWNSLWNRFTGTLYLTLSLALKLSLIRSYSI